MITAWLEVFLDKAAVKRGRATRLPLECAEYPGGLDGWLAHIPWKHKALSPEEDDIEDDLDDEEEISQESGLTVEEIPHIRIKLRSSNRGRIYDPDDVPAVLSGLLRAPIKADPEDLEALLEQIPDVEEIVTEPAVHITVTNPDSGEELGSWITYESGRHVPVPIFERCVECDIEVFNLDDHNYKEHSYVEPEPSCRMCQESESTLISRYSVGWAITDPYTCMECYESKLAPDWVKDAPNTPQLPVPEVDPHEVAAQVRKVDANLAAQAYELKVWKKKELPWLLKLVREGYDPVNGRLFQNLSVDQRILLDKKLSRGGKTK